MSADLLGFVSTYGVAALFLILAATSAGVPFPDSLLLLAIGSVAAQGDVDPLQAAAAAILGAIVGDNVGYAIGRFGGRPMVARITRRIGGADKVARAEDFARRRAGPGIFFTRWLVGPLGPWINIASGMGEYPWPRFLAWDVAGETIWVLLYGGLGYLFSDRVQAMAELLGNLSWAVVGLALSAFLGYRVYRYWRPAPATAAATGG